MSKSLSLLGMACRAGRLSLGHDLTDQSVKEGRAALVLLSSDASENLKREFLRKAGDSGTESLILKETTGEVSAYLPKSVAVLSVDDEGFSDRFLQLYKEGN